MRYRSQRGTIINIPDGLTPKQIAQIKADADAGYGTRAQQTANRLGKKSKGEKSSPTKETNVASPPISNDVVNPKAGTIDPGKASDDVKRAEEGDIQTNFNLSQPKVITDQYGNKSTTTRDPVTGEVVRTDELGGTAQKFRDLATAAAETFNGQVSRKNAEDATYGTITKYYERDRARELEEAKQELANRGIPYDPAAAQDYNTKNLYGRTIGGIDQKYQGLRDDASRQAILAGNQAYATDASARDSFLNAVTNGASTFSGNFGQYQNTVSTDQSQDIKDILALSADAYMRKYGIDQDAYTKKLSIAKQGGSSSGKGGSSGGGFEIVG